MAYLQILLRAQKYYDGKITGIFDNKTVESLAVFQERHEILGPPTQAEEGKVDEPTRDKLNKLVDSGVGVEEEPPTLFDVEIKPALEKAGRNPVVTAGILIIAAYIVYRIIAAYKKRKKERYNADMNI